MGLRKGGLNVRHHAFEVRHHIVIGNTQDLETKRPAVSITPTVMAGVLIVARTVKFDDEFQFPAEKVGKIGANGHLPAELLAQFSSL